MSREVDIDNPVKIHSEAAPSKEFEGFTSAPVSVSRDAVMEVIRMTSNRFGINSVPALLQLANALVFSTNVKKFKDEKTQASDRAQWLNRIAEAQSRAGANAVSIINLETADLKGEA